MRVIRPDVFLLTEGLQHSSIEFLERIGRTAYKSEDKIIGGSAEKFIRKIVKAGHLSVIEHVSFTAKFIVDRGISHEIVRHRLASYTQESTRYCAYRDGITVIMPVVFSGRLDDDGTFWPGGDFERIWYAACLEAEKHYKWLLEEGVSPQIARGVLPTSLKTEVVMTANLREWRHFFELRTSERAHPQIRYVATKLLHFVQDRIPVVFDDIGGNNDVSN